MHLLVTLLPSKIAIQLFKNSEENSFLEPVKLCKIDT